MNAQTLTFPEHRDARGALVAINGNKDIPFDIRRVYFVYDNIGGLRRGFHAHKTLEQVLVCTSGSCDILLDDGSKIDSIRLNQPGLGLYIGTMIWHEMYNFSPDCVLLSLASQPYDEADYIRDYREFERAVNRA